MSGLAVRSDAGLLALDQAKRLIARAIAEEDISTLHELRARATAYELYNARNGAKATADDAGEIKVRAERGLAVLDSAAAPHGVNQEFRGDGTPPLADLDKNARAAIRKLATLDDDTFEQGLATARADEVAGVSTSRVLKAALGRTEKPPAVTPDLPVGVFSTIVADPPWNVKAGPPTWGGDAPSQALEYPTMDVDAIAALDVRTRAADDAHLYLWTINKYVENAYAIARAWGFKPSTLLTWCKPRHGIGLGGTYVLTTEHVLFATRGSLAAQKRVDTSWFEWPRRAHSVKPIEFYELLETVSPGPYLEMFARQPRDGWEVWGNEL